VAGSRRRASRRAPRTTFFPVLAVRLAAAFPFGFLVVAI
jgi:hypothetical protein